MNVEQIILLFDHEEDDPTLQYGAKFEHEQHGTVWASSPVKALKKLCGEFDE